jgi:crotonobetainyl-CoA:carnitine CoA-transferase CaiB-like acyl-CoA transferase
LHNVRVLDLGGFITGPYTAALLAEFGADVIKVERPKGGDPFRALRSDLYSPQFQAHNKNKRSICLEYTKRDGLAVLDKLIVSADVLVLNNRPGASEKLGLGYDRLHSINPKLIYCSITGFGSNGPYALRPAFDHVGQALSGWLSRHRKDDDPRVFGPVIADRVTSYYATIGILAALRERDCSGKGRFVETNMLEATIAFTMEPIAQYFSSKQPIPLHLRGGFSQAYTVTCKDGKRIGLHLSSPDKFWVALCRAIDREVWLDRYPQHSDRVCHYEELAAEIGQIFKKRTRQEWSARLEREGVPFAPEREIEEIEQDPQVQHLGVFHEIEHPKFGKLKAAHRPVLVDSDRSIDFRPPPALGEHNEEILREIGLLPKEITRLLDHDIVWNSSLRS